MDTGGTCGRPVARNAIIGVTGSIVQGIGASASGCLYVEVRVVDSRIAAKSVADSVRAERSQVAKSWRSATALLDCFDLATWAPENAERMQAALAEEGIRTDPSLIGADRRTKVRLLLPEDDPDAPQDLVAEGKLTARLWRKSERPSLVSLGEASSRPRGSFLWLDIEPSAEVSPALDALLPLLPELEKEAITDLLQVDDLPSATSYGPLHKLSTVAVRAVEPQHERRTAEQSKAGALSFLVVEVLAGPDWLLTCWHEPRTSPPGSLPTDGSDVKAAALEGIEQCWVERGDDSLAKLVLLLLREVARSYPSTRRILYSWLEQWEMEFHRAETPIEQATLRDLRSLISEMQRRLHALEEEGLIADEGNWLAGNDTRDVRQDLQTCLDRATRGLTNLAGTLRTATEIQTSAGIRQHLELAQKQADETDRLHERLGLVTSVLLVPGFIAGFFGANTAIPGQGHWSGFLLMVILMLVGGATTLVLFRRMRSGSPDPAR